MSTTSPKTSEAKISREFRSRLARLKPDQTINVVLMLRIPETPDPASRNGRERRAEVISTVRQGASGALEQVDRVLASHHGRRLADSASVLGTIPVEVTVEGIEALEELDQVASILEDQRIHSLAIRG